MGLICTPYGYSGAAKVSGLSYQGVILGDKPVAYWPLNETSGTVAHDLSGNGYTGNIVGGVTLGESGIPGAPGAYRFDGSSGYIYSNQSELYYQPSGTWEIWIKTSVANGAGCNFLGTNGVTGGDAPNPNVTRNFGLYCGTNNTLNSWIWNGSAEALSASSPALNNGGWNYVAITVGANGTVLYVNGAQVASSSVTSINSGNTQLFVGAGAPAGNNDPASLYGNFTGSNFAIYNTVLTAQQILNHYNAGIA